LKKYLSGHYPKPIRIFFSNAIIKLMVTEIHPKKIKEKACFNFWDLKKSESE
jgi:hypothetical protein